MVEVDVLCKAQPACKRGLGRIGLGIPARLSLVDGESWCLLVDLSLHGAMIATDRELLKGEATILKIDRHETFGSIVWVGDGLAGIKFDRLAPKQFLLDLRAEARNYGRLMGRRAAKQWASGMG